MYCVDSEDGSLPILSLINTPETTIPAFFVTRMAVAAVSGPCSGVKRTRNDQRCHKFETSLFCHVLLYKTGEKRRDVSNEAAIEHATKRMPERSDFVVFLWSCCSQSQSFS